MAFTHCAFKSIAIPSSVMFLDGSAPTGMILDCVSISGENANLRIFDSFLGDLPGASIIRYFGTASSVVVPSTVLVLCKSSFASSTALEFVIFASDCHLNRIEQKAFERSGLKSILIPSSVEVIGQQCFVHCKSLTTVAFEVNSKLKRIEEMTFMQSGFQSIVIPSSVSILSRLCLNGCASLASASFENGSKLERIEAYAFSGTALKTIRLRPSVEFVADNAFSS
jgi:hypothetical protein